MREILFRGQRIDNRKFVEGNYAFGYIYTSEPIIELDENYWEHSYGYAPSAENYHLSNRFEVITETVGQFTGLTDKNGVKIFEGDILLFGDTSFVVEWQNDITGFGFLDSSDRVLGCDGINCEVIGNIHKTPELIK